MDSDEFRAELRARAAAAAAVNEPLPDAENAFLPEDEEDDPLTFYRDRADDAAAELEDARAQLLEAEGHPEVQVAEVARLQRYRDFIQRSEEGLGLKLADIYLQHRGIFGLAPNVLQVIHTELGRYAVYAVRLLEEDDEEEMDVDDEEGDEEGEENNVPLG
jgi:hypothetical protein